MSFIKAGSTDFIYYVFLQDSSSSTGEGLTGLAYNTSNLTAYYVRNGAAAVEISLVTQTVTGAHTDGGFVEVNATYCPGLYRIDLPDAMIAAGVTDVVLYLQGATNLLDTPDRIRLTAMDLDDTVRAGLTALPNTAQSAAGGIPIKTDLISESDVGTQVASALSTYDPPTAAELTAAVANLSTFAPETDVLDNSMSYASILRVMAAILFGNQDSGTFRDIGNTKNRAVFTINAVEETRTRTAVDGD